MNLLSISITEIKGKNVIIYGAGLYGKLVFKILNKKGISVFCFADYNYEIIKKYMDIDVIPPEKICEIPNRVVLLASLNHVEEMIVKLEKLHIKEFYSISDILRYIDSISDLDEYELELKAKREKYDIRIQELELDKLVISNLDLVVTEYCNLSCKGCGSLIPYYSKPSHIKLNEIIDPFSRYMNSINKLLELRILGGETFLYPKLIELLEYVVGNHKISKVVLFTNSTIVPNEEVVCSLKNDKIEVHMSNYGDISTKVQAMKEIFTQEHICYYVHNYFEWRDMGDVTLKSYTPMQQIQIYRSCDNKNCPTFYRGKVYVCPRAAHGERLGLFSNGVDEYIDFNDNDKTIDDYKKMIKYFSKREMFEACKYCNGNNIHNAPIPAAIQL